MNKDIKAIREAYNQGINHTTANNTGYSHKVIDYGNMRNEQEESCVIKKRIALELNNMLKRTSRGLKEDYSYILMNMQKLHKDISDVINSD